MASTATASATRGLASPALSDGISASSSRQAAPHFVRLPSLPYAPHLAASSRPLGRESWKTASNCPRVARNVIPMATGEAPAEIVTELPEIGKTIQDAWGKVEDKYAVASLGVAGLIGFYSTIGMISAIERLPLVPGIFELVGIGYTGYFAYSNLIFKPDREVLIDKIKSTFSDIIETSS